MTEPFPPTDPLDRDIAIRLARDARTSFRQIASEVGVTEGTVRTRVKRLQNAGLLRLAPIVDIAAGDGDGRASDHLAPATNRHMAFITVRCQPGCIDTVRAALLAMPQVEALYDANSARRIVAICLVDSLAEVAAVTNAVIALDGIRDVDSELVLQTIKYEATIGPIATVEDSIHA